MSVPAIVTMTQFNPVTLRQDAVRRARQLTECLELPPGTALAATGSFARQEMTTTSDLDLILLHRDGEFPDIEKIWYPIWDSSMHLDSAVRTPRECSDMMHADAVSALALLDLAHVGGDPALTAQAREKVLGQWRRAAVKQLDSIVTNASKRWQRSGSLVSMTRPDIKYGRGGLRDHDLVRALTLAHLVDAPDLSEERRLLLDVRTLLHAHTHRSREILEPEFAVDIATDLGFSSRYKLSAAISEAAATIDSALTSCLSQIRAVATRSRVTFRSKAKAMPIAPDVVARGDVLSLSRTPDLADSTLVLRVGAAAARHGLRIDDTTYSRLKELPELPQKFPRGASDDFVAMLSSAEHSADVIASFDAHGLWDRIVPEWAHIRGRLPRERTHVHTVDVHTLDTVTRVAEKATTVARPDLLLVSALYHDVGKGFDRPHEEVGAEMVKKMAKRLGFNSADRARLYTVVEQHTLLARLAETTDPNGPEALDELLEATNYDPLVVSLLAVLAEADAQATGPGVWNMRREAFVRTLTARAVERLLKASELRPTPPMISSPTDLGLRLSENNETLEVLWRGYERSELIDVLAVIAAKAWNITAAQLNADDKGLWHCVLRVRPATTSAAEAYDEMGFVQSVKSGVYKQLPALKPGALSTYWLSDRVLEVRMSDQSRPSARYSRCCRRSTG